MKNIKISHEVTLGLLEPSLEFNDYDYCLPHLLDKHSKYLEFFINSSKSGRFIIMDNGLFEGVEHTEQDLIEKINLIKPDIFVVPDVWNDPHRTLQNAQIWMANIKPDLPEKTNLMVVMQGNTLGEFMNLYNDCVRMGYKHFAFNHSSKYYQNDGYHPNPLMNQMMNRVYVISRMYSEGIIKDYHYIHLLGCSLPQEMLFYKNNVFPFIKSVDTSSPIINGLIGNVYEEYGLLTKPHNKIEEYMNINWEYNIDYIHYNITKFKEFTN